MFGPFDDDMVIFLYLCEDAFFHELAVFLDPIHVDVKKLGTVGVQIRIGRALDVMLVQSESFGESFGEQGFPCSQFSVQ
jgi:hypothetical protein